MLSIAYSTTTGMSGLIERVTVGPSEVAYVSREERHIKDEKVSVSVNKLDTIARYEAED